MVAIRGATTVDNNTELSIRNATRELLLEIIKANQLIEDNIISIIFSSTKDVDKLYPAVVAREIGLLETPLFCVQEMYVENSLKLCIRVLIHTNKNINKKQVKHIYMKKAINLRPDIVD